MQVMVEEAVSQNIPAILDFIHRLDRPKPDALTKENFSNIAQTYLNDSDKFILVARMAGGKNIVGMVSIILLPRLNREGPEMYIPELIVTEECRSSGVGKFIIQHCITMGKKLRCHRIRLESANYRKDAHGFYTHLGFIQDSLSFLLPLD